MSAELEKKIARLERSLKREKSARKQAEELLEQKSRDIYMSSEGLKAKFAEADLKQKQLSFLTGLSADIWHVDTITAIVQVYLKRTREFLNKSDCVFFQIEKKSGEVASKFNIYGDAKNVDSTYEFVDQLKAETLLSSVEDAGGESQIFEPSMLGIEQTQFSICFILPVFTIKQTIGVACFLYTNDELDVFKLQTVESSRAMLTLAIQRKTAAASLQSQYKELKQAYEQIDDAQKQLVQSEKMASLGQLAAGVAHEINNPIGFILSNYETLADYVSSLDELLSSFPSIIEHDNEVKGKLDDLWQGLDIDFIREDIGELLGASKGGLVRIKEIVSGLKSFSHADTQEYVEFDLNVCIEDSIQLVWNELKYNCEIDRKFGDECLIKGNAGQLQQVFVNLLVNAKQAMDDNGGGTITIETVITDKSVTLKLADTGSGIAQKDLDKLFTPFFTTKPVGVGTGLGLSISYGILQDHGATIEVESAVGKGTAFIMEFPLSDEAE